MRTAAVKTLGKLPPEALATQVTALMKLLKDRVCYVRDAAVETLGKLPSVTLGTQATALMALLDDKS